MDEKTLTALRGSIAKWEAIIAGTMEDKGSSNCPLCQLFNSMIDENYQLECNGCPVAAKVKASFCSLTPYSDWQDCFGVFDIRYAATSEQKAAAQAELDFLRSLLPGPDGG